VITGNCNQTIFLIFRVILYLPTFICIFSYSGEGFFILYKESKENRKVRNVRLVGNKTTPASS